MTFFILLFTIALFAGYFIEAGIDGGRIIAHQRINHTLSITIWAVIFGLFSLAAAGFSPYMGLTQWNTFGQVVSSVALLSVPLLVCMAIFSTGFRIGLNRIRGHSAYYISPSSWYDYVAISLIEGEFVGKWIATRMHWGKYMNNESYKENVHRAASLLYLIEAIAYIAGGTFTLYLTSHGS